MPPVIPENVTPGSAEIACLLIPGLHEPLLLPNACVVEIIPPLRVTLTTAWLPVSIGALAHCQWQSMVLPLLQLTDTAQTAATASLKNSDCIIVLHGIHESIYESEQLPYWGILSKGLPRLIRVSPETLRTVEETDSNQDSTDESHPAHRLPWHSVRVERQGEIAVIPDLDYLEQLITEQLRTHQENT